MSNPKTPEQDPILALKREWDARDQRLDNEPDDSDAARDPLYEARSDVEYAILRTPATTIEGVAIKLWLWARCHGPFRGPSDWWKRPLEDMPSELDELPVASALQDLERLAGEARS